MNDALYTGHIHCRARTSSTALLPHFGNPPISNALMTSKRPHTYLLIDQIKSSDPLCARCQRANPRNDSSNPHSAIATTPRFPPLSII